MKKKENAIAVIVSILILLGGFVFFLYGINMRDREMPNKRKTICAYIQKTNAAKGSNSIFIYYVNGKKYRTIQPFHQMCLVAGQRYMMIYNYENPDEAQVVLDEPVFSAEQITNKSVANITTLQSSVFYSKIMAVMFTYSVGDLKYETYQFADWKKYNVKIGDTYELEYLVSNPKICIIHLDRKIK